MKLEDLTVNENQEFLVSAPCVSTDAPDSDKALHEEAIDLFEMANLGPNTTGIQDIVVWVNGGVDKLRHGPRIKVVKGNKWRSDLSSTVPLTGVPRIIGNAPITQEEFAQIVKWINLNRDLLMRYGNNEMDTAEFIQQLRKI